MKLPFILAILSFTVTALPAQRPSISVNEGDIFTIHKPSGPEFKYIKFPKKNFIIKRGAVPDMKKVYGTRVVVTSVDIRAEGTRVTLAKRDGGKFFRYFRSIEARIEDALESGELTRY
jgi:hypothetical protein